MTCARRLAGARRPTPSTPADSPRSPEPLPGRSRARLFGLLPVLALLLGAFGLFAAAPTQAQGLAAPSNIGTSASHNTIRLTWDAVTSASGYQLQLQIPGGTTWGTAVSTTSLSYTYTSLTLRGTYMVRIRTGQTASGTTTYGAWSQPVSVTLLPAAPTNLQVSPGNAKLTLSWTAPTETVTGYDVHYTSAAAGTVGDRVVPSGSDPSAAWVAVTRSGTTASQTISPLNNGTRYRVRVRGKNDDGNGALAFGEGTPAVPVVDFGMFIVEAVEGASSAVVTLTIAPVLETASSVRLVQDSGDQLGGLPRTITLPAGTASVEVDLAANLPVDDDVNSNSRGANLSLEAVNNAPYVLGAVNLLQVIIGDNDPPAAPAGLSLAPGDRKLTASWTKPAGRVLSYELRHKETSATDQAATTAGDPSTGWVTITLTKSDLQTEVPTTAEITGLPGETAYQVQVRAWDGHSGGGNGWSEWSAVQTATTPVNVTRTPDPDLLTGLTVHDGTRDLFIDANRADDLAGLGGPDAIYTVQVNPGINSVTVTPTWTNMNITGVSGSVRHVTYDKGGTAVNWSGSQSGTGMELVLMDPSLPVAEGTTELTLSGVTSEPYVILFQHNFDWGSANDRLGKILMRSSQ